MTKKTGPTLALVAIAVAVLAAACGDDNDDRAPVTRDESAGKVGTRSKTDLTDAQIMAVTTVANQGEVAQAKAALPKLTRDDARQFATMMVQMHTDAQTRQEALGRSQGMTPEDNELSRSLKRQSDAIVEQLHQASEDVDRTYMQAQVSVHTDVLKTIDERLLPAAKTEALKQELKTARAEVSQHLERARSIAESPSASR